MTKEQDLRTASIHTFPGQKSARFSALLKRVRSFVELQKQRRLTHDPTELMRLYDLTFDGCQDAAQRHQLAEIMIENFAGQRQDVQQKSKMQDTHLDPSIEVLYDLRVGVPALVRKALSDQPHALQAGFRALMTEGVEPFPNAPNVAPDRMWHALRILDAAKGNPDAELGAAVGLLQGGYREWFQWHNGETTGLIKMTARWPLEHIQAFSAQLHSTLTESKHTFNSFEVCSMILLASHDPKSPLRLTTPLFASDFAVFPAMTLSEAPLLINLSRSRSLSASRSTEIIPRLSFSAEPLVAGPPTLGAMISRKLEDMAATRETVQAYGAMLMDLYHFIEVIERTGDKPLLVDKLSERLSGRDGAALTFSGSSTRPQSMATPDECTASNYFLPYPRQTRQKPEARGVEWRPFLIGPDGQPYHPSGVPLEPSLLTLKTVAERDPSTMVGSLSRAYITNDSPATPRNLPEGLRWLSLDDFQKLVASMGEPRSPAITPRAALRHQADILPFPGRR